MACMPSSTHRQSYAPRLWMPCRRASASGVAEGSSNDVCCLNHLSELLLQRRKPCGQSKFPARQRRRISSSPSSMSGRPELRVPMPLRKLSKSEATTFRSPWPPICTTAGSSACHQRATRPPSGNRRKGRASCDADGFNPYVSRSFHSTRKQRLARKKSSNRAGNLRPLGTWCRIWSALIQRSMSTPRD